MYAVYTELLSRIVFIESFFSLHTIASIIVDLAFAFTYTKDMGIAIAKAGA